MNFTPMAYEGRMADVGTDGSHVEWLSGDDSRCSGSGVVNVGMLKAKDIPCNGRNYSIEIIIPPLGASFIKRANIIQEVY